jgi:hypothetical protein
LGCLIIAAKRFDLLRTIAQQKARKNELKKEMAKRLSRSQPIKNLQA